MSQTTREINRITSTIISVSCKVLMYILVLFLLYEGATRGYSYGHEVFAPTAMAEPPGRDHDITIDKGESVSDAAKLLKEQGLIKDDMIVVLQAKIYEYEVYPGTYTLNTSQTSKDMLKLIDAGGKNSGDEKK